MPGRTPITQRLNDSEVRERWTAVLNGVAQDGNRVVVERGGIAIAAVVSADDLARLNALDQGREVRFAVLDRIGAAFRNVPPEEVEQAVAQALAEVRAEQREATSGAAQA